MSDGATGSAILAGNPSDGAVSDGGIAAPAPAANEPAVAAPAAPATGKWSDSITDAELKGYVENKGWKDPVELANGYKNLEKLLGGEKIPMPKGAEDKEGWDRVYDQLGRPKSAEDYKLPVAEGQQPTEFTKEAAGKFHELGLTAAQAEGLAAWYNDKGAGAASEMQAQSAAKSEAEMSSLKTEWGGAYDENVQMARMAAREYGLNEVKLNALENALGTGEMMKLMAKIGRAQGEHTFETGKGGNQFGMTPEAARQRIDTLRGDQGWTSKYLQGDADAKTEMMRLQALAYPE